MKIDEEKTILLKLNRSKKNYNAKFLEGCKDRSSCSGCGAQGATATNSYLKSSMNN